MTTTIAPQVIIPTGRPIPKASDFVPIDRKPDTSRNRQRGPRKSPRRKSIL